MTPEEQYTQWVHKCGGTKVIRRILIANNGMAAAKFIISIRNFLYQSFGCDQLIHIIAMATPEDMKASAKHLHLANAYYAVPGGPNFNNYANVSLITSMAKLHEVDAVWPGWGHASENPELPKACEKMGIIFIGPRERPMFLLGDKIASTIIAQSAQVPCVSWSGSGVDVKVKEDGSIDVDDETFLKCCVSSAAEALEVAERVGYPIMIKASEGGGGKGVRKAIQASEVEGMYQQVADEVKGSPIFLMRLCYGARHIEMQVMADKHKNVFVLSGRDCSMQRRFQKIVEEGPPIAVAPETLRQMELAAARLARMVDYTHAGTVEYLFIEKTQEFYFLELNPRLQVEHPVTESITGLNIPSLQLIVSMGCDLTKIDNTLDTPVKDIAPYLVLAPGSAEEVESHRVTNPFSKTNGHCVAVRVTAENAADGWKPTVGTIKEIDFQSMPGVWGYFSVRPPDAEVHAFADSQFGHIFAHAPTRKQANYLLTLALKRLRVVGELHTNIKYVEELIMSDDFIGNDIDTAWLDKIIARKMQLQPPAVRDVAVCGALLKASAFVEELEAKLLKDYIKRNALPPPEALLKLVEFKVEFIWANQKFSFEVFRHAKDLFTVAANGSLLSAKLIKVPGGSYTCLFAGESHRFHYEVEPGDRIRMTLDGKVVFLEKEKDPSVLAAPYGGKLTRYLVEDGTHLDRGGAYAEVEVMKMLFNLTVGEAGVVSLAKGTGNVAIEAGERLGTLALDDPSLVAKAEPFISELGDFAPPLELRVREGKLHMQLQYLTQRVHNVLDGYTDNEEELLKGLSELLIDPTVMCHEWDQLMMGVGSKLPDQVRSKLKLLTPDPEKDEPFGAKVLEILEAALDDPSKDEASKVALKGQAAPVFEFGNRFKGGPLDMSTGVVRSFIEHFLRVEKLYPDDRSELLGVFNLCQAHPNDPATALQGVLSHCNVERKVHLMLSVLDLLGVYTHMDASILGALKELSQLMSTKHLRVQRKAKQIAANFQNNIVEQNKELVLPSLRKLASGSTTGPVAEEEEKAIVESLLAELTLAETKVLAMLGDSEKVLRKAVAKAAVLLWYSRYQCRNLSVRTYLRKGREKLVVSWTWTNSEGTTKDGFLFVFSSIEDMEGNFDDLVDLALKDRPKSAPAASPADASPPPKSTMSRSYSGQSLSSETSSGPPACLHVLVLGEGGEQGFRGKSDGVSSKRGSIMAVSRSSFRYAILDEAQTSRMYYRAIISKSPKMRQFGVDQVSVQLLHHAERDAMDHVSVFNFDAASGFEENKLYRHILPTQAELLELHRLSNFEVERCWFPDARLTHVYHATAKTQKLDTRLFVRTMVLRPTAKGTTGAAVVKELMAVEMDAALDVLELSIGDSRYGRTETNHIYFHLLAPLACTVAELEQGLTAVLHDLSEQIKLKQAYELELVLKIAPPGGTVQQVRIVCALNVGVSVHVFAETLVNGRIELTPLNDKLTPLNDKLTPANDKAKAEPLTEGTTYVAPYKLLSIVDQKRLKCLKLATTYAYDYLHLFELAVSAVWDKAPRACGPAPVTKVEAVELVLSKDGKEVVPLTEPRPFGANKVGMLAWLLTLFTPECPSGRPLVIIANDITFANGTFGPKEDEVFEKASIYSRERGIPRMFIGCNSGAKFGLADSVLKLFRVEWNDPFDFSRGIKYLWLTDKDVEGLGAAVVTEKVKVAPMAFLKDEDEDLPEEEMVEFHNKIVSIIGTEEGLGVESLQGAGKIAAETSIANRAVFTLGYSTARNIGIGSYVLRLGQRVIQHNDAPIILTGFQALNKLLGTSVYESNAQLGGPEVMGGNGVAHLLVDTDLQAMHKAVEWLSFVPSVVGAPPPCLPVTDPIERAIGFYPPSGQPYDPRKLLAGDGSLSGLLDSGSFVETLAGWAKTVVTGRGRLGGMPIGVIVTENRLVEKAILADPANLESKPEKAMQAGQVWFPDSAYKTAQAIQDFNIGEGLPLLVLANWRGFSGGRKDMFEEVLKFGSFIVDQLTQFKQPIFVYIPPFSEIRGGAWVVIDSTINPRCMEMYAAEHARGGVLEPAGIAEIKFRKPELIKAMHRMDKQLKWMSMNEASGVVRPEDIASRETELLPSYQPLGEIFCDLHDRPERMLAKGVIKAIVPWKQARTYFYYRLKRRFKEMAVATALAQQRGVTYEAALAELTASLGSAAADDKAAATALDTMYPGA